MKSNDYWGSRARDALYNKQLGIAERQLAKEYQRSANKTKKDLEILYAEIIDATTDGSLLVSDLYKYNKYYDLLNNLNQELNRLGIKEQKIYEDNLIHMYKENCKLIGKEIAFNPRVSNDRVKTAINNIWCPDGKAWSDRIWTNKALLVEKIKNGVIDSVARGDSKDRLVKDLMETFNQGFRMADRIARTEIAHVQVQSSLDTYKDAGIEYYEILTAQDDSVCDECYENTEPIPIDQGVVGVNLPPFHPNCRCDIVAVIQEV